MRSEVRDDRGKRVRNPAGRRGPEVRGSGPEGARGSLAPGQGVGPEEYRRALQGAEIQTRHLHRRVSRLLRVELEDLQLVAETAVWDAARQYERGQGTAFTSWAWRWVREALRDWLRDSGHLAPWLTRRLISGEVEPEPRHLAPVSLEQVLSRCPERLPAADVDVEAMAVEAAWAAEVRRAVEALPRHLRSVIERRFYENASLSEVATAEGLTKEGVRRRQDRALALLRERLGPEA
jgi:RNA polymerase sigma factor (sigma-70 family)